jgi:site-specific DNA-methyltransferase (adenine-specific)
VISTILKHQEGLQFLSDIPDNSVDLILTDPPYITSRDSGMDKWVDHIAKQDISGSANVMSEADWEGYKTEEQWGTWFNKSKVSGDKRPGALKKMKADFLKYGSIYGKKYAVKTNYGEWDSEFTMEQLELFTKHFYRILKPSGTCIMFFDLWKITNLKEMLETEKFKQIRLVEWIKTNPQPINSSVNYLTNCREIALLGIKKSKPTFNSKYDKGIYHYPLQGGKNRFHPTQKSLPLFEELMKKHSNEGDTVLDCFAGSATTAIAAQNTDRNFIGCEMNEEYFNKSIERIKNNEQINTKDNVLVKDRFVGNPARLL